jgi:hypothetical protein
MAKHFVATGLQYSSLSVKEGGMNVLSPYSFGLPLDFDPEFHLRLQSTVFMLER